MYDFGRLIAVKSQDDIASRYSFVIMLLTIMLEHFKYSQG